LEPFWALTGRKPIWDLELSGSPAHSNFSVTQLSVVLLQASRAILLFQLILCFFFIFDAGHTLDDKSQGNPIGEELLSLTQSLKKLTGLANNLTAEYKEKFDLLF